MDFDQFLSVISRLDRSDTGGFDSHLKMIPKERIIPGLDEIRNRNPRKAAVLALFYPDKNNETLFLLILRADYDGTHAAQIGFPGGKFETNDQSLKRTALRETFEEVGVRMEHVKVKKRLTDTFIPPSNFIVRPYLGVIEFTPEFSMNHEVQEIIEVKLADLLNETFVSSKNLTTSYMQNIDVPCFELNNRTVWGATAMMLSEIKDLIRAHLH
jgi:8-oxo-dGTP pyrophosphatase MutT (NUDIX family)